MNGVRRWRPANWTNYQNVPMGTFAWTEQALLAGDVVLLDSLDEIPRNAKETRKQIEMLGFKSTLQLPLQGRGGLVKGCIALNSLQQEVIWTEVDVKRLRLVGDAIANALERRRLEEELRQTEARYRATFEKAPVGIANVSIEGRILKANHRLCDMLGHEHEEVVGRHYIEFTHPADRKASTNLYEELLTHRKSTGSLLKRHLRKDGSVVWGNVTLSLLENETGEPNTIVAAVEDVTARKNTEEVFNGVPDLIFVLDQQHRIIRVNRAAANRLQSDHESLLGRPCYEVMHGTSEPPVECPHLQVLADGREHSFEIHEPRLDGDYFVSCTPLYDACGAVTGSVHVARDITALKRSEAELPPRLRGNRTTSRVSRGCLT